jgi:alpha-N-arabinofuranosidase
VRIGALFALPLFLTAACSVPESRNSLSEAILRPAKITVNLNSATHAVSPLLFGASIEWTENGNRIFDPVSGTVRARVETELSPLRIPVWRFPGGILADYYHWSDGVGPRNRRPVRTNPMDASSSENNFGSDELIDFCRVVKGEPLITANLGTGSLNETLAWQQHFIRNGMPVRLWEIGNEIYLAEPKRRATIPGNDERIFKSAAQYAAAFREWSHALHAAAPDVLVGAIAGTYNTSRKNRGWLETIVSEAGRDADFLALHNSFAPLIIGKYDFSAVRKREQAYLVMYAHALAVGDDIRQVRAELNRVSSPAASRIAITEHFPLFGTGSGQQLLAILDQSRTIAAALYTASLFHTYMREGVWMANYNLAVSKWFGALVLDTDSGLVRAPVWYVFDLYRNHFGNQILNTTVDSPVYSTAALGSVRRRDNVPFLDAIASQDQEGNYYLAVINRHPSASISGSINIEGRIAPDAQIFTLRGRSANAVSGKSLSTSTDSGPPNGIATVSTIHELKSGGSYSFPPTSITIIEWHKTGSVGQSSIPEKTL